MANTTEKNQGSLVAVFGQHSGVENGVKALKDAEYDTNKLSLIGRDSDSESNVVGFYRTGGQMKHWGRMGRFWERHWHKLMGEAVVLIPGLSLLIMAGSSIVNKIERALHGSIKGEGLCVLEAALYSLGISKDSAVKYAALVKAGKFILIAHGTADDVQKAYGILQNSGAEQIDMHMAPTEEARVA